MNTQVTNPVGIVFHSLASDLRLRILNAVNDGCTNSGHLPAQLGVKATTIHKALPPLEHAGLIERKRLGWWRGEHQRGKYELTMTPLALDLIGRVLRERDLLVVLAAADSRRRAAA